MAHLVQQWQEVCLDAVLLSLLLTKNQENPSILVKEEEAKSIEGKNQRERRANFTDPDGLSGQQEQAELKKVIINSVIYYVSPYVKTYLENLAAQNPEMAQELAESLKSTKNSLEEFNRALKELNKKIETPDPEKENIVDPEQQESYVPIETSYELPLAQEPEKPDNSPSLPGLPDQTDPGADCSN